MPGNGAFTIIALALAAGLPHRLSAQGRQAGGPAERSDEATLTIEAKAGGKSYQGSGSGTCEYAPEASIRGVPASLWMVQYAGSGNQPLKRLNLTLWQPKSGAPDQLSVSLETKSGSHRIEAGGAGKNSGAGAVTIERSGPGGTVRVRGIEASGKAVQITIQCSAFGGVEAEGG